MQLCALVPAIRRSALAALAGACLAGASGCADVVADSSACRKLEYKDGGVERSQYLPCVAEMMTALDELDRHAKATLEGDARAQSQGQAALRRVFALMGAAGGRQLLERWPDRTLTDLNLDISNAMTHYQAFYMICLRNDPNEFTKTVRAAATAEYEGGNRRYEEAKRLFRRIN